MRLIIIIYKNTFFKANNIIIAKALEIFYSFGDNFIL